MIHKTDRSTGRPFVIIFAGELYVTSDELVSTTVGGCVAVCIITEHASGLNHYLLPNQGKTDIHEKKSLLYGVNAITALIHELERKGCRRKDMKAVIAGGSDAFLKKESPNVSLAKLFLEAEDIRIIKTDIGGNYTRKVILDPLRKKVIIHKREGIFKNGQNQGSDS